MTVGIGRRQVMFALGAAATYVIGATQRARSQTTPKPLRIGFVHPVSPKDVPPNYVEFIGRLRELGYVEGDTLAIEYNQPSKVNLEGHLERYEEGDARTGRGYAFDLIFGVGAKQETAAAPLWPPPARFPL